MAAPDAPNTTLDGLRCLLRAVPVTLFAMLVTSPFAEAQMPTSTLEARIVPLTKAVMSGRSVEFSAKPSIGDVSEYRWDFGDGSTASGVNPRYVFSKPGIYRVTLTVRGGDRSDSCFAIVRAHSKDTLHIPQVLLDTDAKNEQDDQHYLGYALFSELDVLGINSTHHGGGQEPVNYGEILNVIELSRQSGLPESRVPTVYRGANLRLTPPESEEWYDTQPIVTEASEAILAAARGASPSNPVWVVPVGPATNPASAILQARREGLDLKGRVRFLWLGGSDNAITGEFNGNNDPWSAYVMCDSGIETWVVPAPVGALVTVNKATQGDFHADNPLGRYLRSIVPDGDKPLFDPCNLAAIISERLGLGWVKRSEAVRVSGPRDGYRWEATTAPSSVRVIRDFAVESVRNDIFETMKGRPTRLLGAPVAKRHKG